MTDLCVAFYVADAVIDPVDATLWVAVVLAVSSVPVAGLVVAFFLADAIVQLPWLAVLTTLRLEEDKAVIPVKEALRYIALWVTMPISKPRVATARCALSAVVVIIHTVLSLTLDLTVSISNLRPLATF